MPYSPERNTILRMLRDNNVPSLWHFTNIENLKSIFALDGLYSKEFLEENGFLDAVITGGNEISHTLDRRIGNWDKISLNFTPHTPMAYRIKPERHLVFIEIDVDVATYAGVVFTDCNAARTSNGQLRGEGVEGLQNVRFEQINARPRPWDKDWIKHVQAEVLVPRHVPMTLIKSIHFISSASKEFGEYVNGPRDIFAVRKETFYDNNTIQCPYMRELIVTKHEITDDNIDDIIEGGSEDSITAGRPFWIMPRYYVTTGSRISVEVAGVGSRASGVVSMSAAMRWPIKFIAPSSMSHIEISVSINGVVWLKRRVAIDERTVANV